MPKPNRGGSVGNPLPKAIGALAMAAVLVVAYFAQFVWFPDGISVTTAESERGQEISSIAATSDIVINEVMGSNSSAFSDENGAFPDYVELLNTGSAPVDLYGLVLTDNLNSNSQFVFPSHVLQPGEIVLVFCDDGNANAYGSPYHAPFKISSAGDTVMLCSENGTVIETVNVPALGANEVYMRDSAGNWSVSTQYTPGLANTAENHASLVGEREFVASDIEVTEIMADNATYAATASGAVYDYIEIHNKGGQAVSLNGMCLSDTETKPTKWRFPDVTLGPGEFLIVYASGLDAQEGNELHANFKLSAEGEQVVLADSAGRLIEIVSFDNLKADQAYSKQPETGVWTTGLSPTPGSANTAASAALIEGQFAAQNATGVYISEFGATTTELPYDWVEIFNSTNQTVDISGWGLSDDPSHPRKWQFPQGTTIGAGEYMGVFCSGLDTYEDNTFHTNFSISATGGESLTLCTPEGEIFCRVPVLQQYTDMSYGRIYGQDGYFYFTDTTPRAANAMSGYRDRALSPEISVAGGLYTSGEVLSVELSAPDGGRIYYTLDCSDPDENSILYTGPITISSTTILRAVSVKDGSLTSLPATASYLYDLHHTLQIVSLVTDPDNLFSDEKGIYTMGPNATSTYPYGSLGQGANFWMDWERDAHVEIFALDGSTVISQGCGIKLHGQYSRAEEQKAFKVIARSQYGDNRFRASLFPNRDYTEYQSFLLRASGQDTAQTFMRDSIITSFAADLDEGHVMYQDTALCVVYLNGEYWGCYNMRERVNTISIAQWEGWTSDPENIDLVKANTNVMQGSNETYEELRDWVEANGIDTDEKLAYVAERIDIKNYLDYVILQIYFANTDLLNVKKYRSAEEDGLWRWVLFDTDGGMVYIDQNSVGRMLNPAGAGRDNLTYNKILRALLKNEKVRNYFLTRFGELLVKWSAENVLARIDERYLALKPEMEMHYSKWPNQSTWEEEVQAIREWAMKRQYILFSKGYIQGMDASDPNDDLTDEEMQHYFGEAMAIQQAFQEGVSNGTISTDLPG